MDNFSGIVAWKIAERDWKTRGKPWRGTKPLWLHQEEHLAAVGRYISWDGVCMELTTHADVICDDKIGGETEQIWLWREEAKKGTSVAEKQIGGSKEQARK